MPTQAPLQAPDSSARAGVVALSAAAAAGLAVGVALGCCAAGALLALALQRWQRSRRRRSGGPEAPKASAAPPRSKPGNASTGLDDSVAVSAVSNSTSAASLVGSELSLPPPLPAAAATAPRRPSQLRAAFDPAESYTLD
jgi:hypothetical protein